MNISNAEKERRRLKITDEIEELSNELTKIYVDEKTFSIVSDKKNDILKEYLAKRTEIKQYLPNINDLVINNTIYIVFDIHAKVQNPHQFIQVPESMTLFKLMTSDYGTISCPHKEIKNNIKYLIHYYTERRTTKYTKRNNIKFFKMLMKKMIDPLQESIDRRLLELQRVTQKKDFTQKHLHEIGYGSVSVKNAKNFTTATKLLHIHNFIDSRKKMIKKDYYIDLNVPNKWNQINVMNVKYPKINLVDYVDTTVVNKSLLHKAGLKINMKDIFDLFKHIKYVFLVDFSCSNTDDNDLKQFAQNTEGNSITQEIENYNNSSPYNILNENEQELEDARLKLLEKAEINFDKGYNNLMKSRNPFWRNSPNLNENQMNKSNNSWLRRALRFTRKLYN
jgi:hypothetical protein